MASPVKAPDPNQTIFLYVEGEVSPVPTRLTRGDPSVDATATPP